MGSMSLRRMMVILACCYRTRSYQGRQWGLARRLYLIEFTGRPSVVRISIDIYIYPHVPCIFKVACYV